MDHASQETATADGSDLDPDIRRFIRSIGAAIARHPDFDRAPFQMQRRWAEEAREPWRQGGPAMIQSQDLSVPTRHGPVRARLHRPASGILPGLVYLHGGGWTLFSIETHDRVMREYASRAGCCVVGVDYALSPEYKFPVPLQQAADVVDWLESYGGEFGIDGLRLAIGGDSAGANLSLATCLVRRDRGAMPPIRGMVLNYGAFSAHTSPEACRRYGGPQYMLGCDEMRRYWKNYLRSDSDEENPLACPMHADFERLPPAFLAIAECDVLAEQSIETARRLRAAGVPATSNVYTGASHSFIEAMSIAEVSVRALVDASEWLNLAFRQARQ